MLGSAEVSEQAAQQTCVGKFQPVLQLRRWSRDKLKWMVTAAIFSLCIALTFVSYKPYICTWDDAGYLLGSIEVSRILWSGHLHGLRSPIAGVHPPAMMLLGLPWGPLSSWDAAGKCFVTLAAVISLLAGLCFY